MRIRNTVYTPASTMNMFSEFLPNVKNDQMHKVNISQTASLRYTDTVSNVVKVIKSLILSKTTVVVVDNSGGVIPI